MSKDTIFALSSGSVPSGVAIVRVSGPGVRFGIETIVGFLPEPRKMVFSELRGYSEELLDKGLVVFFPGPNSFTGEDCSEFHIHGSRAVLSSVLSFLGDLKGFRVAEAGEFSRRAFENGRLDLTEVEGLSDLIKANTDIQRKLALSHSSGELRLLYNGWRNRLIKFRAYIEAGLDFSEEEDVPVDILERLSIDIAILTADISFHLNTISTGEIIRDGFKVSLVGAPNSGKSSLLNTLAGRDVAIVSDIAGTTRDVISVSLNLNGYEVVISDTAGIHDTDDIVENLGIERALDSMKSANLVLVLQAFGEPEFDLIDFDRFPDTKFLTVRSKSDLPYTTVNSDDDIDISVISGDGIDKLESFIGNLILDGVGSIDGPILSRLRHKLLLQESLTHLSASIEVTNTDLELVSEELRVACDLIGRIVGKIDVEDLLDVIFGEFCIGK